MNTDNSLLSRRNLHNAREQIRLLKELARQEGGGEEGLLFAMQAALMVRDSYLAGMTAQLFPGGSYEECFVSLQAEMRSSLQALVETDLKKPT